MSRIRALIEGLRESPPLPLAARVALGGLRPSACSVADGGTEAPGRGAAAGEPFA
jgi:hypothetical protein